MFSVDKQFFCQREEKFMRQLLMKEREREKGREREEFISSLARPLALHPTDRPTDRKRAFEFRSHANRVLKSLLTYRLTEAGYVYDVRIEEGRG